ncbi:MAG: glycoside hydrolase family 88 protein [Lachnospiraceae bacterium]|nr:glycoside hydrolase family 88 protein [Lachnospiraceae bacterium]
MQTKESLVSYDRMNREQVEEALTLAVSLVEGNVDMFTDCFPDSNSQGNFYPKSENVEWTTGFWTGEIWLAYEETGSEKLKHAGEIHVESFLDRILRRVDVDHHDMGFLYSPSCVAAWQLTGNEKAKRAALLAADNLMSRFCEKGQFFQAWGKLGAPDNYRLIIDCLLNMPLLFWASEVTGDAKYATHAKAHIRTAMQYIVRPDYSTYHTYFFNPETGEPIKGVTHQGHRHGSAWTRGQAWGIYGSAMAYRYIKDMAYQEIFEKVTEYFLLHLPSDLIPYWDFDFDDGSAEPRDSSSAAIAACGMLEMTRHMTGEKAQYYEDMAKRLLLALRNHCAVTSKEQSNGLLMHGTYARKSDENPCANRGVDECNTWGDYYYLEGLVRLHRDWKSYW